MDSFEYILIILIVMIMGFIAGFIETKPITHRQRQNRIKLKRYLRKIKKEFDMMIPFLLGLFIVSLIVLNFFQGLGAL